MGGTQPEWGVPISQVDVPRTWLDFTLTPPESPGHTWHRTDAGGAEQPVPVLADIAYLLGLEDDSFYRDVTDHDSAQELRHLFDLTIGPPDENSRVLTAAMVGAQADLLASAPQPLMPRAEFFDLIHGILRRHLR